MDESDFWEKNNPIMFNAVRGLYAPGWTIDDLLNEARFGIWEASKLWSPEMGCSWYGFAYTVARRRVMDIVTISQRKKNLVFKIYTDVFTGVAMEMPLSSNDPDAQIDRILLKDLLRRVSLTQQEQEVIDRFLQGYSYEEIANELEIKIKTVDNAKQRVIKKLKALM